MGGSGAPSIQVEVVNVQGLHARPAHKIVLLANEYPCRIVVRRGELEVDAKSIMSLMMLAAEKGTRLEISADGDRADEALEAIAALFASGFDED